MGRLFYSIRLVMFKDNAQAGERSCRVRCCFTEYLNQSIWNSLFALIQYFYV